MIYLELAESRIVARLPQDTLVRVGDTLALTIDTDHIYLFDSTSGRRL